MNIPSGLCEWSLTTSWFRIDNCSLWGKVIDGYICEALNPTSPPPSEILSKYFGLPVRLVMKGPKRRACDPTRSFPDLDASAIFQDGFPLLVASEESLGKVGDEINRWAHGEVNGRIIKGIDDLWKTSRVPIERCAQMNVLASSVGKMQASLTTPDISPGSDRILCFVVPACPSWKT